MGNVITCFSEQIFCSDVRVGNLHIAFAKVCLIRRGFRFLMLFVFGVGSKLYAGRRCVWMFRYPVCHWQSVAGVWSPWTRRVDGDDCRLGGRCYSYHSHSNNDVRVSVAK